MQFFKNFSMFHKIFFLVFFLFNIGLFLLHIGQAESLNEAITPLMIISLISSLTGIFAAIYTARGQVIAYIWGFFNVSSYIFVSTSRHMYGEVLLYVLYMLPMQFVGFYIWRKSAKQSKGGTVEAKKMTKKNWITFIIFFFVFWAAYATLVYNLPTILDNAFGLTIPHDKEYLLDSLTATLTVCAVILATNRFIEQWYLWIIADVLGIVLYISSLLRHGGGFDVSALSGAMMWCQFTINSIYGFMIWRKLQNKKANLKIDSEDNPSVVESLEIA